MVLIKLAFDLKSCHIRSSAVKSIWSANKAWIEEKPRREACSLDSPPLLVTTVRMGRSHTYCSRSSSRWAPGWLPWPLSSPWGRSPKARVHEDVQRVSDLPSPCCKTNPRRIAYENVQSEKIGASSRARSVLRVHYPSMHQAREILQSMKRITSFKAC